MKPIFFGRKPWYLGQSDRNLWNSARFSFPPMLQIQRNFHQIMHDSKFGRDGSFLIVLKKHHVLFFEESGTQLFKIDRQSRHAFQVAKFVIIRIVGFLVHFSPHDGTNHFFGNSAVMVRFAMDLLGRPQNLIGIGQQVVAVRSNKVVTHCDTFKQVFCCKTVHRIIQVSALARFTLPPGSFLTSQ